MRHLLRVSACVLIAVALWAMPQVVLANDVNRDLLKKDLKLVQAVEAFGQPIFMEWVNLKGTPVLFIFYPSDESDTVQLTDGRTVLPLGFVTESLEGWGKDYYQQTKFPTQ